MIRASLNRGSRLGSKTSVQGKPCTEVNIWDLKVLQVFIKNREKILVLKKSVEVLEVVEEEFFVSCFRTWKQR